MSAVGATEVVSAPSVSTRAVHPLRPPSAWHPESIPGPPGSVTGHPEPIAGPPGSANRGLLIDEAPDDTDDAPDRHGARVTGWSTALGERASRRPRALVAPTPDRTPPNQCASSGWYSMHAGVPIAGQDAVARERLCRYILRPPFHMPDSPSDRTASASSQAQRGGSSSSMCVSLSRVGITTTGSPSCRTVPGNTQAARISHSSPGATSI